jgi:chorismate--pyruvate lyase
MAHPRRVFRSDRPLIPVIQRLQEPPHWYRQEQLPGSLLAPVRSWLLDDGSLTQRLLDTGRDFSLERLAQRWARPAMGEQRLLSMARRERALVRQVALKLDHKPVVYARSVFPMASLTGSLLRLRRLANQSLGSFLFAQAGMRRSPFEVALLAGDSRYLPTALHQEQPVWARRSCFMVHNKALLVSEVFLDDFPGWQAPMPLHRSRRGQVSTAIGRTTQ